MAPKTEIKEVMPGGEKPQPAGTFVGRLFQNVGTFRSAKSGLVDQQREAKQAYKAQVAENLAKTQKAQEKARQTVGVEDLEASKAVITGHEAKIEELKALLAAEEAALAEAQQNHIKTAKVVEAKREAEVSRLAAEHSTFAANLAEQFSNTKEEISADRAANLAGLFQVAKADLRASSADTFDRLVATPTMGSIYAANAVAKNFSEILKAGYREGASIETAPKRAAQARPHLYQPKNPSA